MLTNPAQYAAKKRKKPVQKIPKQPPPDGAKSNPSKRHRDRLNGELDKLTSLLPFSEEVRSRLDKLSVLRLSVGYLKAKNFFNATLKKGQNGSSWTSQQNSMSQNPLPPSGSLALTSRVTSIDGVSFSEGDLLLKALNGFVMVVTAEGYVFYTSPTIQDFLGFHQSDVVHQSVFELIHTDDRALFRRQLHFALNPTQGSQDIPGGASDDPSSTEISTNVMTYDPQAVPPENSSFLERNFCCRFRCLLDNSSGFLALNFRGRLKLVHGQHRVSEDGTLVPPQLAFFCVATPMQPPAILEIRTKTLIFQTKHRLDFSPMGIDSRGKLVLGFSEVELRMKGSGYNFIHAADMMYCADTHIRMMKTGESGFRVFRLLSKSGTWVWVQASSRMVFKAGQPDFIIARQKALTNEEGEEQLRVRQLEVPFGFATGEGMLYDVTPTVGGPNQCSAPKQQKLENYSVSTKSLLGCLLNQDQSLYCPNNGGSSSSSSSSSLGVLNDVAFSDSHATLSVPSNVWLDSAPKVGGGGGSGLSSPDDTVQDMMETLQQILGEDELADALDVAPDELKSWESKLLSMSCGGGGELGASGSGSSDDLGDLFSSDIFAFVEEQLRQEGGLKLDDGPPCFPPLDLQDSAPVAPTKGTVKLTHMELPLTSGDLGGPTLLQIASDILPFGTPASDSCAQNQRRTLQSNTSSSSSSLGAFPNQLPANQLQLGPVAPPLQSHLPLPGQSANPAFGYQGGQWNSGPAAGADLYGLMHGRFVPQAQNNDLQRPTWEEQQQQQQQHVSSGCFQRSLTSTVHNNVHNHNGFRAPQAPTVAFPLQQGPPPTPMATAACMFANSALPRQKPVQIPSKPPCFYQSLPGMAAPPNPEEVPRLSCKVSTGLDPDQLLVAQQQNQQQQYLDFSQLNAQMNGCPVDGNGDFGFPSLPTGSVYYSEKQ
ncbi:uncharacterized protein LOC142881047 [Nelusetta ayraudi]|uniref:uncharacterized protein LOC142881047 n=1 Tax=Nelusetta ayraudi TaxID=303726 RepID=UPI003F6E7E06